MTDAEIKTLIDDLNMRADMARDLTMSDEPDEEDLAFVLALRLGASALTQLLAERQGQPIETAPKDRPVIIQITDATREPIVGEAQWREDGEGGDWWWAGTKPGDYYTGPISDINFGEPTHWWPLPAPIAQVVHPKLNT